MYRKYMLILSAVIMAILLFVATGCPPAEDPAAEVELTGEQTIVALLQLTGPASTLAENARVAAELATADVNAWLQEEGREWSLRLLVEDDAGDPPTSLRKMQSWYGDGVRFFAGPQSSASCREVLAFANANEILFVSQWSTAPVLATPDDWLFRFVIDDTIQGPVIAALTQAAGIKHLIFTWRGDTWGDGLQKAVEDAALELGGIEIFAEKLRYDAALEDFTVQAASLDSYVTDLLEAGAALEEIGIVALSFEEIAPYLIAASEYPQLRQVRWFGSDGSAKAHPVIESPVAAQFAFDTKFVNLASRPEIGATNYPRVREHVLEQLDREPDAFAFKTYDIIWSLAMAIDEVGYDPVKVKEIFPRVADEWSKDYGASGHVVLNEAGDRAFADNDLWMVSEDLTEWVTVGYRDYETNEFRWEMELY